MFLYTTIEAIVGIVAFFVLAVCSKKEAGVFYGKLDKLGRFTNLLLAVAYILTAPVYLFLGMISEPDGEGPLLILGVLVSVIAASASLFCSLGLGLSVSLRKKGASGLSFAVQFAGVLGIGLTVLLYVLFEGSLISPLN